MNEKITYVGDLILLRGIPGSGKTTLGNAILKSDPNDVVDLISADDYFVNENGEYVFEPSKIKDAHLSSQKRCEEKMINNSSKIVIANTFTQEWEMEKYYEMAKKYNYRVFSVIVENRHGNQNVHNVPHKKITEMVKRFDIKL